MEIIKHNTSQGMQRIQFAGGIAMLNETWTNHKPEKHKQINKFILNSRIIKEHKNENNKYKSK